MTVIIWIVFFSFLLTPLSLILCLYLSFSPRQITKNKWKDQSRALNRRTEWKRGQRPRHYCWIPRGRADVAFVYQREPSALCVDTWVAITRRTPPARTYRLAQSSIAIFATNDRLFVPARDSTGVWVSGTIWCMRIVRARCIGEWYYSGTCEAVPLERVTDSACLSPKYIAWHSQPDTFSEESDKDSDEWEDFHNALDEIENLLENTHALCLNMRWDPWQNNWTWLMKCKTWTPNVQVCTRPSKSKHC